MKTLFVMLFMGIACLFPTENPTVVPQQVENLAVDHDLKKRTRVNVSVTFGRRKKNCRGFGICRAAASVSNSTRGTNTTVVVSGGKVTIIEFHKRNITKIDLKKFFSNNIFIVEEDFSVKLKHEGGSFVFSLKAGKYKLKATETGFLLEVGG